MIQKQYWALEDEWNALAGAANQDEVLKSDLMAARKSLAAFVVDVVGASSSLQPRIASSNGYSHRDGNWGGTRPLPTRVRIGPC